MTGSFGTQLFSGSTAEKVIQFPQTNALSTSGDNIGPLIIEALKNPQIEHHLKGIIEGAIMDATVNLIYKNLGTTDNPFDSIYISELKADEVLKSDVDNILKHSRIVDLSDTITFDDEWDD